MFLLGFRIFEMFGTPKLGSIVPIAAVTMGYFLKNHAASCSKSRSPSLVLKPHKQRLTATGGSASGPTFILFLIEEQQMVGRKCSWDGYTLFPRQHCLFMDLKWWYVLRFTLLTRDVKPRQHQEYYDWAQGSQPLHLYGEVDPRCCLYL